MRPGSLYGAGPLNLITMIKPKTEKKCKTCGEPFRAFRSTDRWCSHTCIPKEKKKPLGRKFAENNPSYTMPRVSKKQAKLERQYAHARKAFLTMPENRNCAVYPERRATEVHHMMGRVGYADDEMLPLIVDVRYFLAVSREGHEWIERNPIEAKERGWSVSRIKKVKKK